MRKEIHIVSNPNRGGWDAKRPNADRASKHFDTKKEAMEWGRDLAKREGLELIPHGTDGKIQIPTAMEMTHVHPRTPGIKHYSSWT